MLASVIVPTRDRSPLLGKALTSVAIQIAETGINCELITVDNSSTDDTRAVVEGLIKQFMSVPIRYIYEPVPGLLSCRHRGALEAKGDVLAFIDDDVETGDNWLAALAEVFSDQTVQLCGGKNVPVYESPPPEWMQDFWFQPPYGGRGCIELSLLEMGERPLDIDATYIFGLNFAIRKKALFDLGGFHPDALPEHLQHLRGDGETGLSQKANAIGYRAVYQPGVDVHHFVPMFRMTPHYLQKRHFRQGISDSYTHIRTVGRVSRGRIYQTATAALKGTFQRLGPLFKKGEPSLTAPEEIRLWCTAAYQDGFQFHQRAVACSRELREWVLRPDYWDYRPPDIALPKRLRRRATPWKSAGQPDLAAET
jgi:glucosyl-dolichyl phosphate glucuronosyltransferase